MAECFPEIIIFNKKEESKNWKFLSDWQFNIDWLQFKQILYNIFKKDFIDSKTYFRKKPVSIDFPDITGTFKHITSTQENNLNYRVPDIERSIRLSWLKTAIENADCEKTCCTRYIWEEIDLKTKRPVILILYLEDRYKIVLTKRINDYYIKSAFYIDREHELEKNIKKYKEFLMR